MNTMNAMTTRKSAAMAPVALAMFKERLNSINPANRTGYVREIVVTTVRATLPGVMQGELCEIESFDEKKILGEVVAFSGNDVTISCLESVEGITLGAKVSPLGRRHSVHAHAGILGHILDGMGRNMVHKDKRTWALSFSHESTPVMKPAPIAADRPPISSQLITGVRIVDALNSFAIGQRVGIFAPPGCGKTTLMSQIARGAAVDVVVFALVGERGRELREFMETEIDDAIREKSVFVCATSDRSPTERVRAAFTAMSIAEHFRDQGKSVLLLVDSITRLARAQREIGLMAGEPTTSAGFTPSVYSLLPQIVERAGLTQRGSITAIFTVLMESDKFEDDPVANEAKSLLDGHLLLSQKLVEKSRFPAVDPLRSLSRVMDKVTSPHQMMVARAARQVFSTYQEMELMIRLNEYQPGTDALVDEAVKVYPELVNWARQPRELSAEPKGSFDQLQQLVSKFMHLTRGR